MCCDTQCHECWSQAAWDCILTPPFLPRDLGKLFIYLCFSFPIGKAGIMIILLLIRIVGESIKLMSRNLQVCALCSVNGEGGEEGRTCFSQVDSWLLRRSLPVLFISVLLSVTQNLTSRRFWKNSKCLFWVDDYIHLNQVHFVKKAMGFSVCLFCLVLLFYT